MWSSNLLSRMRAPLVCHAEMLNISFAFRMSSAAFQEYSTADANCAVKIPDTVSFSQAATICVTWYTAIVGLCHPQLLALRFPDDPFSKSSPPPEATQPILIWGAGSGIGRACVQILYQGGYSNILATSAPNRFDDLKSIGAKEVFDYRQENVVDAISSYLAGRNEKLLVAYDPISTPATLEPISKVVSAGGVVATVTPQGQDIIPYEGGIIRRARTQVASVINVRLDCSRTLRCVLIEFIEKVRK